MVARKGKHQAVSICIVSWRTKRQVEACLRSIYQTVQGISYEIVLVDNASRDGTVEMIESNFPAVNCVENAQNLGFPRAANQALFASRGQYVLLLNPDTIVLPNTLENLVAFMNEHPEAGAVTCKILNPDGTLQTECRRMLPTLTSEFFELTGLQRLFPNNRIIGQWRMPYWQPEDPCEIQLASGACLMIRRRAIEEVGALSEEAFMYLEDLDYCYRLRQKGWRVYFCPGTEIIHQGQQSSMHILSHVRALSYDARYKFFRMHYGNGSAVILRIMVISAMGARLLVYLPFYTFARGRRRRGLRFSLTEFWHTLYWGVTLRPRGPDEL
jgi:GT2 family glycosyltransferase